MTAAATTTTTLLRRTAVAALAALLLLAGVSVASVLGQAMTATPQFPEEVAVDITAAAVSAASAAGATGFQVYRQPRLITGTVSIADGDNDYTDWDASGVRRITQYPYPDDDLPFLQQAWIAHDSANLYLRLRAAGSFDLLSLKWFFDTDQSTETGFHYRGMNLGAEVLCRYDFFHKSFEKFNETYLAAEHEELGFANFYNFTARSLYENLEIAVPLGVLFKQNASATLTANELEFLGADMLIRINQDTYPTIGYGYRSPSVLEYGWKPVTGVLPLSAQQVVDSTAFGGAEYEYKLARVFSNGDREVEPGSLVVVDVPSAHPEEFNVQLASLTSVNISWVDPGCDRVRVIRRVDHYAENASSLAGGDAAVVFDGPTATSLSGNASLGLLTDADAALQPITAYFYAAYCMNGAQTAASRQHYDSLDRTMLTNPQGPLPGITATSDYMVYFSNWDAEKVDLAEKYDLVILHPGAGSPLITAAQVLDIRDGEDDILGNADDTLVVGYISIGEDYGQQNASRPWFNDPRSNLPPEYSDGTGPVFYDYDRGVHVYENLGLAPWYVDQHGFFPEVDRASPAARAFYNLTNSTDMGCNPFWEPGAALGTGELGCRLYGDYGADLLPDQNTEWGGLYVDSGHPMWQQLLRDTLYETYGIAGFDYILDTLGMDGCFLDTLGVSAPWSYWDPASAFGDFYWIRDGHLDFVAKLAYWYPSKVMIPNRPMHFCFRGFAGKRYDDFLTYVNGVYWESYTADVEYWWAGQNGVVFEEAVRAGREFYTPLVLDYYRVMTEAQEGGEFQYAPWYETPREQAVRAEGRDMITAVSPSRSLAEWDDYVYLVHHPDRLNGMPDLQVHRILPAQSTWNSAHVGDTVQVEVGVFNRGQAWGASYTTEAECQHILNTTASPCSWPDVTVRIWHNDVELAPMTILGAVGMDYEARLAENRAVTVLAEGNNIHVEVDTLQALPEYDEQNNQLDTLIDQFFHIRPGHVYRHDPEPDLAFTAAWVEPAMPALDAPFAFHVNLTNNGLGVATTSTIFIWLGGPTMGGQVANYFAPYVYPGATREVVEYYTALEVGAHSAGYIADATAKVLESEEGNNVFNSRFFVVSSHTPACDWAALTAAADPAATVAGRWRPGSTVSNLYGPLADALGDGTQNSAPLADWSEITFAEETDPATGETRVLIRMELVNAVSLDDINIVLFINTDNLASTGYSTDIGGDILIASGVAYRFTGGASQGDWSWEALPGGGGVEFIAEGASTRVTTYAVPESVMAHPAEAAGQTEPHATHHSFWFTLSDSQTPTLDDDFPAYGSWVTYPPSCGDGVLNQGEGGADCGGPCATACPPIIIDGDTSDWNASTAVANGLPAAPTGPWIDQAPLDTRPEADGLAFFAASDNDNLYLKLHYGGATDWSSAADRAERDCIVFLQVPGAPGAGYSQWGGQMNASHFLSNGVLFEYLGDGSTWSWRELTSPPRASFARSTEDNSAYCPAGYNASQVATAAAEGTTYEVAVPRAQLGWDLEANRDLPVLVGMYTLDRQGTSVVWADDTVDYVPDAAPALFQGAPVVLPQVMSWRSDEGSDNPEVALLALDDLADHVNASSGGATGPGALPYTDILAVWSTVGADATTLRIDLATGPTLADMRDQATADTLAANLAAFATSDLAIMFDVDANASSGYAAAGGAMGAEFMWLNGAIFAHDGPDGPTWAWSAPTNATAAGQPGAFAHAIAAARPAGVVGHRMTAGAEPICAGADGNCATGSTYSTLFVVAAEVTFQHAALGTSAPRVAVQATDRRGDGAWQNDWVDALAAPFWAGPCGDGAESALEDGLDCGAPACGGFATCEPGQSGQPWQTARALRYRVDGRFYGDWRRGGTTGGSADDTLRVADAAGDARSPVDGLPFSGTHGSWADARRVWAAVDSADDTLALRVEYAAPVNAPESAGDLDISVFIDVDGDPATGYVASAGAIGADALWSAGDARGAGALLHFDAAGAAGDRTAWSWTPQPRTGDGSAATPYSFQHALGVNEPHMLEARFLLSALGVTGGAAGLAAEMRFMVASTDQQGQPLNWTAHSADYAPELGVAAIVPTGGSGLPAVCRDGVWGATEDGVDCGLGAGCPPCADFVRSTDGDSADAAAVELEASWRTDAALDNRAVSLVSLGWVDDGRNFSGGHVSGIAPAADILALWSRYDADALYLRVDRRAASASWGDARLTLFLDVDGTTSTGYRAAFGTMGADLMWVSGELFEYNATADGVAWDWQLVATAPDPAAVNWTDSGSNATAYRWGTVAASPTVESRARPNQYPLGPDAGLGSSTVFATEVRLRRSALLGSAWSTGGSPGATLTPAERSALRVQAVATDFRGDVNAWATHLTDMAPAPGAYATMDPCDDGAEGFNEGGVDCGGVCAAVRACPHASPTDAAAAVLFADGRFSQDWQSQHPGGADDDGAALAALAGPAVAFGSVALSGDALEAAAGTATDPLHDGRSTLTGALANNMHLAADLRRVRAGVDADWLHVFVELASAATHTDAREIATGGGRADYSIFIDVDRNASTGYLASLGALGAEFVWINGRLSRFTGGANQGLWSWSPVANASAPGRASPPAPYNGTDPDYVFRDGDVGVLASGNAAPHAFEVIISRAALAWDAASGRENDDVHMLVSATDRRCTGDWQDDIADFAPDLGQVARVGPTASAYYAALAADPNATAPGSGGNDPTLPFVWFPPGECPAWTWNGGVSGTAVASTAGGGSSGGGECFDGVWGPNEDGVDCGGFCAPCERFVDHDLESSWRTDAGLDNRAVSLGALDWVDDARGADGQYRAGVSAGADLLAVWHRADGDALHLRVDRRASSAWTDGAMSIFFDTDANPNTGYRTSWGSVGAELMWYSGALHRYNATADGLAWDWGTGPVATAPDPGAVAFADSSGYTTSYRQGTVQASPAVEQRAYPNQFPLPPAASIRATSSVFATEVRVRRAALDGWGLAQGEGIPPSDIRVFVTSTDFRGSPLAWQDHLTDAAPANGEYVEIGTCNDGAESDFEAGVDCGGVCSSTRQCPSAADVAATPTADGRFSADWWFAQPAGTNILPVHLGGGDDPLHDGYSVETGQVRNGLHLAADLRRVTAGASADWLSILVELAAGAVTSGDAHELAAGTGRADYSMYFDTDQNTSTGYLASFGAVGAEFAWFNGRLHAFGGGLNQGAWSWTRVSSESASLPGPFYDALPAYVYRDGDAGATVVGTTAPHVFEVLISRAALGWTAGDINMIVSATDKRCTADWRDDIADFAPELGFAAAVGPNAGAVYQSTGGTSSSSSSGSSTGSSLPFTWRAPDQCPNWTPVSTTGDPTTGVSTTGTTGVSTGTTDTTGAGANPTSGTGTTGTTTGGAAPATTGAGATATTGTTGWSAIGATCPSPEKTCVRMRLVHGAPLSAFNQEAFEGNLSAAGFPGLVRGEARICSVMPDGGATAVTVDICATELAPGTPNSTAEMACAALDAARMLVAFGATGVLGDLTSIRTTQIIILGSAVDVSFCDRTPVATTAGATTAVGGGGGATASGGNTEGSGPTDSNSMSGTLFGGRSDNNGEGTDESGGLPWWLILLICCICAFICCNVCLCIFLYLRSKDKKRKAEIAKAENWTGSSDETTESSTFTP